MVGKSREAQNQSKLKILRLKKVINVKTKESGNGLVWGDKIKPEKGMMLALQAPDGKVIRATVMDLDEKDVTISLNHPLSGKDLTFKVKIVEVN